MWSSLTAFWGRSSSGSKHYRRFSHRRTESRVLGQHVPGFEPLEDRRLLAFTPVQFYQALDAEIVGERLYFSAAYETLDNTPGNVGVELWISDSSTGGTRLLKDIIPGLQSSSPENLTNVNGTLFFTARTPNEGVELWKSDGTTAGTVLVKDTSPGTNSGELAYLTNINGLLYFRARGPNGPNALWISDGTTGGTVMLKELYATQTKAALGPFVNVNGVAFFNGQTDANGAELWKSNGTSVGTVQVKDINPGSNGSGPQALTNVSGTLFFGATNGVNGFELWTSDGSEAGTTMVKDLWPGAAGTVGQFANLNGVLYFNGGTPGGSGGAELYKSDGTSAGTVLVKDLASGAASGFPTYITNVNGTLYFRAESSLWSSDGTTLGTNEVSTLKPTIPQGFLGPVFVGNGNLVYYPGSAPNQGIGLYKTDGTQGGTGLVSSGTGNPGSMVSFANALYFIAEDSRYLFRTDGVSIARIEGLNPADTNGVFASPFPYADSFDRPDSSTLSGPWLEQVGDLRIVSNKVEIWGNTEAIASLNGLFEDDISVSADYDLSFSVSGQSVGVVGRYGGLGDANFYMARVIRGDNATYGADMWVNVNGTYTPIASVATNVATGNVRMDIVGNRLSLYVNNVLLASVTDNTFAGHGSAGIRQTGGKLDNFLVTTPTVVPPQNATLPFADNFNRANSPDLGPFYTERIGDLQIHNDKVVQLNNTTAIATLNGPNVSNVTVQGDVDLTTLADTGSSLGLLARYTGPGDENGYLARLYRSAAASYFVQLWRNIGSGWEFVDQNSVGSGAGTLRFSLTGTTLEVFFNNVLQVNVTDSAIAGPGLIGIRHAGGSLDNFSAT